MTAELGYGSTAGTPRETTALLEAIWLDLAGPAQACAQVRSLMSQQIWPHRLASGFPDEVRVAAKTGTLPGVRNEVGVVEGPDGRAFAVAVFTRSDAMSGRAPAIDAAIGTAARIGMDHLRALPART